MPSVVLDKNILKITEASLEAFLCQPYIRTGQELSNLFGRYFHYK